MVLAATFPQQGCEFSEELFDGVEVWAVRGQVALLSSPAASMASRMPATL